MKQKLVVGDVLAEVFETYRTQAGVLLPAAFWLFLIVAIVDGVIAGKVALLPIELAVTTVVATLYQGMVVGLVRDMKDGRRDSSVGDLIRSATPVVLPLIGAGLLSGIGIGIGIFFLIIPGLFLLTIWAVIAPVIVVERSGVLGAFGRSRTLVRGNGWGVFGAIAAAIAITIFAGLILGLIAATIADGPLIRIVFNAVASTFTAPITALVASVLYFRLRSLEASTGSALGEQTAPPPSTP